MKHWIQSYTGLAVTPLDLRPEQVALADVAHALALKTRFTGHTRDFYSVAQHCVLGSQCLPPSYALAFLLHDVSEAYLPDIAAPLKECVWWCPEEGGKGFSPWAALEAHHVKIILTALGHASLLPLLSCPEVRAMDAAMCIAERDALLGVPPNDWGLLGDPAPVSIKSWGPLEAESNFLRRYERLQKEAHKVGL